MTIRQATIDDLDQLSILFAQYRVFYKQPFEPAEAKAFLEERLTCEESIVFIAIENDQYAGFTQLYPSFSSVGMTKIWILNDLYVSADHRQKGIARSLINHVIEYSKATGRKKVALSTAYDNTNAQKLYEKLGFTRSDFYNYEITL
ncbi:MAG TPA: GNAT family N-acetyltransferase [Chitinophagaceae bacterium]|nr:GNAT family N-acetyltransferase [Chitinophagaceae bacterium]